jgi:hypothetical protein
MFLTLPFSKSVFIFTSPPQEQKNFCVALEVREFLLAWAIFVSSPVSGTRQKPSQNSSFGKKLSGMRLFQNFSP